MSDDPVPPSDTIDSAEQPLLAHLLELRRRLLWCVCAVLLVFCGLAYFANDLFHFLSEPLLHYLPNGTGMLATEVIAPFTAPFKLAFVAAIFLSVPVLLYHLWAFVAPGLYQREKRIVMPMMVSSVALFYIGVAFAYFLVFPVMFGFMSRILPEGVTYAPDISRYLDVVLGMFVAFGVVFETPVVVILLNRMGVVSVAQLKTARAYVIVGAFVVAAIVTPPDVISQTLLALPLIVLYELGIVCCRLLGKRAASVSADEE